MNKKLLLNMKLTVNSWTELVKSFNGSEEDALGWLEDQIKDFFENENVTINEINLQEQN